MKNIGAYLKLLLSCQEKDVQKTWANAQSASGPIIANEDTGSNIKMIVSNPLLLCPKQSKFFWLELGTKPCLPYK